MNLQPKRYNVPSKDKLPRCSVWFRLKAYRKLLIARKKEAKHLQEHKHEESVAETVLG